VKRPAHRAGRFAIALPPSNVCDTLLRVCWYLAPDPAATRTATVSCANAGFSKSKTAKIIETVLHEEGRPPERAFDFAGEAFGKAHQGARLELEGSAKRLIERAALIWGEPGSRTFGCAASVSRGFKLGDVAPIRLPDRRRARFCAPGARRTCGSARRDQGRTLGTFSSSRSAGLTPKACDVCQIVRSVAFWSPRSIPLIKARSTPIRSATASWLMPAASRIRRTFAPKILRISIRRIGGIRVFWRYVL
jgi:hypothetical protein